MDQRIINLYDEYTHKPLPRKEFIKQLIRLVGTRSAAIALLPLLEVNYASAAVIPEKDDDLIAEDISYEGEGISMNGYYVRPKTKGKHGAVIVIHENRGLNPHIRDITRRVAKAGYLALAPDALSPFGGTPINEDEARTLFGQLDAHKNLQNFLKGLTYMRNQPESNKKMGCVGFCWGGALTNQLAVSDPLLNAAVAFYGRQPDAADVYKMKARVQLHYGGLDERINAGIPAYEEALKLAAVKYELYVYEGAQHAFHNDKAPARYNEPAAKLAWERTIKFFNDYLN